MLDFRPLTAADQAARLHIALWDPPPAGLRPREVLEHPAVRIYAEQWGRQGDIGVVAVVGGVDAGACWMRVLPEGVGLASVDAATPQLGIALRDEFRGRGLGKRLMLEALARAWRAGHAQVALTVHPENPAVRMYERCGFRRVDDRRGYHLMIATAA